MWESEQNPIGELSQASLCQISKYLGKCYNQEGVTGKNKKQQKKNLYCLKKIDHLINSVDQISQQEHIETDEKLKKNTKILLMNW